MKITRFYSGSYYSNCYLVLNEDGNKALIIDPIDDSEEMLNAMDGLELLYIVNTHGHFDHISGNSIVQEKTKAPIVIGSADAPMLIEPALNLSAFFSTPVVSPPADIEIEKENNVLKLGRLEFRVLFFPGHTEGGLALYQKEEKALISGDFIFQDSIGRMDSPSGSVSQMKSSLEKVMLLPSDTRVYPGHGLPFLLSDFKNNIYPEIIQEF